MSALAIITALVGPISSLLEEIIPDVDKREKMAHEIATKVADQSHEIALAQIEVAKAEAANPSLFVSGWRPFVGWTCGISIAFNYVAIPLTMPIVTLLGLEAVAPLDLGVMMPVLLGMLGLGTMRTVERHLGVARVK